MSRIVIVGSGLIGTSVGLALRGQDVEVRMHDRDEAVARQAVALGAGALLMPGNPPADVCVLAVPPEALAATLRTVQRRGLATTYTDVASAKRRVIAAATALGCDLANYVPGHPIAGAERGGPAAARIDLFAGRPWALCPTPHTRPAAVDEVAELVRRCGAWPTVVDAAAHDRIMAEVSHAPHVVASVLAARFAEAGAPVLSLLGRGVLDATRIAAGDAALWTEIVEHNRDEVADVLAALAADLQEVAAGLRKGRTATLTGLLERGRAGRQRMQAAARDGRSLADGATAR